MLVALGFGVPISALAQDLSARAAQIEALLASGDAVAARHAARDFMREVQRRSGFAVENIQLTVSPASGYGVFEPRQSRDYLPNEPIFAYVEVFGFSLTRGDVIREAPGEETERPLAHPLRGGADEGMGEGAGDGMGDGMGDGGATVGGMVALQSEAPHYNNMLFDVAFTLLTSEGEQLTPELIPMGEVELATLAQPVDGFFTLTYRITGVSGAYVIYTEVTDRASGATTSFRVPVNFVSDTPEDEALK